MVKLLKRLAFYFSTKISGRSITRSSRTLLLDSEESGLNCPINYIVKFQVNKSLQDCMGPVYFYLFSLTKVDVPSWQWRISI